MKKFISSILLFISIAANAQLVSYTPLNADFETSITIQFNLNLSQGEKTKNLLGKTAGLYLWGGAGSSDAYAFEFVPKTQINFNAPVEGWKISSPRRQSLGNYFEPKNLFCSTCQ